MKGKLRRTSVAVLLTSLGIALSGCATTAAPQELSILDAMSAQSLSRPQSCAALNAATMCIQTMRLSRNKDCGCVDRQAIATGNFASGF